MQPDPYELRADPHKPRELARWYRDFAQQAGSSAIWDSRLRTSEQLDAEADRIERTRMPAAREEKAERLVRAVGRKVTQACTTPLKSDISAMTW